MRITPLDIRKQEFKKAMRGLDSEEVHAFLTTVAEEYEAALSDNKALRERVLELDDKVQEYRTMERTLRDTLLTAERVTADAKENARREADLIIKEAQIEAEKVLRDIKNQAMKLRQEVQDLRRERDNYMTRMKMLAESYLKFIEGETREFEQSDQAGPPTLEEEAIKQSAPEMTGQPSNDQLRASQPEPAVQPSPEPEPEAALEPEPELALETEEPASIDLQDQPPVQTAEPAQPTHSTQPVPPAPQVETLPAGPAGPQLEKAPETVSTTAAAQADTGPSAGSSLPDLNAILDRMVANQKEMLSEEDAGYSLADPPESEDIQVRPEPKPGEPALPQMGAPNQVSEPAGRLEAAPQPPQPDAEGKKPAEQWSLDKIKKDILANSSQTE